MATKQAGRGFISQTASRFLTLTLMFAVASISFAQRRQPRQQSETVLYVWASDQAHMAPFPGRHRL